MSDDLAHYVRVLTERVKLLEEAATIPVWQSWTPQIDQGASTDIAHTVSYSSYVRVGKTVTYNFFLALTAGGTAGSAVTVSIPVAAVATVPGVGTGQIYDSSTSTRYGSELEIYPTTSVIGYTGDSTGGNFWGAVPSLAIASGDSLRGSITYEAA